MTTDSPSQTSALFARVKQWFDADGWHYDEREPAIISPFQGKSAQWPVVAELRGQATVVVLSLVPFPIPEPRRAAVMEAVTRANAGLSVGGFDFDLDSGALQFRTALDVEGDPDALSDVVLRHLVYQNVVATDHYLPAFQAVLDGEEPEAAIDRTEGH